MSDDKKDDSQNPPEPKPMTIQVGTRVYRETPITMQITNTQKEES